MTESTEIIASKVTVTGEILGKEATKNAYAIVGIQDPDEAQATIATQLAFAIAVLGRKTVRTGAFYGVDQKAMEGTGGINLEVFLPWDTCNNAIIPENAIRRVYNRSVDTTWTDSVYTYHPCGRSLSDRDFAIYACDFGIISQCTAIILLPTEDGRGVEQSIRIAEKEGIEILQFNRGESDNPARRIGWALQQLGFASKDLRPILSGGNSEF